MPPSSLHPPPPPVHAFPHITAPPHRAYPTRRRHPTRASPTRRAAPPRSPTRRAASPRSPTPHRTAREPDMDPNTRGNPRPSPPPPRKGPPRSNRAAPREAWGLPQSAISDAGRSSRTSSEVTHLPRPLPSPGHHTLPPTPASVPVQRVVSSLPLCGAHLESCPGAWVMLVFRLRKLTLAKKLRKPAGFARPPKKRL